MKLPVASHQVYLASVCMISPPCIHTNAIHVQHSVYRLRDPSWILQVAYGYYKSFLQTMHCEWVKIDRLRLDKFMMLVRKFLGRLMTSMAEKKWYVLAHDAVSFCSIAHMRVWHQAMSRKTRLHTTLIRFALSTSVKTSRTFKGRKLYLWNAPAL